MSTRSAKIWLTVTVVWLVVFGGVSGLARLVLSYTKTDTDKPSTTSAIDAPSMVDGTVPNFKANERIFQSYIRSGSTHEASKEWEKAIDAYTQALRLKPDDPEVKGKLATSQHNLYLSRAQDAEKEEAIKEAEEAKEELAKVKAALAKTESERDDLRTRTAKLSESLENVTSELSTVKQAREQLQAVVSQAGSLKEQLSEPTKEKDSAIAKAINAEAMIEELNGQLQKQIKTESRREYDEMEKVSYIIGTQIAQNFKKQDIEVNLDSLIMGLNDALEGKKLGLSQNEMKQVFTRFQQQMRAKQAAEKAKAETEASRREYDDMEKVSYIIGTQIASKFKSQDIEVNIDSLAQGIKDALADTKLALSQADMTKTYTAWQQQMRAKQAAKQAKEAAENLAAGTAFLEANKAKEGVKVLPSGLQYKVITEGTGNTPTADDKVKTHYRGTLIDGTEFDSSYKRNKPAEFPVKGVIKGWTEALQLMKEGGKWELYIPANLAYGQRQRPGIPSNSTMIFEIELLEIIKADPAEKAKAAQPTIKLQ